VLSPAATKNLLGGSVGTTEKVKEASSDSTGNGEEAARPVQFKSFGDETPSGQAFGEIEMLMDLSLPIVIELGRTSMFIKDILNLTPGSIIELDKLSGDPVDIYVNDKKFAEGEVVVIDENFGVRITELVKPEDRVRKLS
jgi:flagellar motor switch protein FliN/FliY